MLEHLATGDSFAPRTVVLGAAGFGGGAIVDRLRADGAHVLALGRAELDLQAPGAGEALAGMLRQDDAVVCVAARAPVKSAAMLRENLVIVEAIAHALRAAPVSHIVNIGSDAIYADSTAPLDESSPRAPTSLHGVMHLARELILAEAAGGAPLCTLRPTLIYGARDPHNGYGPNRFRRLAAAGQKIVLFGEGEERRDHVWIEDVARLASLVLSHKSRGALNAATGTLVSFRRLAELLCASSGSPVPIEASPRRGPMPHGGYRAFDPAATHAAFPEFRYASPTEGLARVHEQAKEDPVPSAAASSA